MAKLKFSVGAISDIGMQRANNEDNLFVPGYSVRDKYVNIYNMNKLNDNRPLTVENVDNAFFAVCDGMGGHNGGEDASFMAVSAIRDQYSKLTASSKYDKAVECFNEAIDGISCDISYAAEVTPALRGMGATLGGLYFYGDMFMPVNVGDSRVYRLNHGRARQISMDHTDESSGKGVLTRYLGVPSELGTVTPYCGIGAERILEKTRFLICSDGLTDMLDDENIGVLLSKYKSPADAAYNLVETAKKMGGKDNVTVEVIDVTPTANAAVRAFKRPRTYIAACIAAAVIAGGGYAYNNFFAYAGKEYHGISIEISKPDKELVNSLAEVSDDDVNKAEDPSAANYISEDESLGMQIKKLEMKLDTYDDNNFEEELTACDQAKAWYDARIALQQEKKNALDEFEELQALRQEAYDIKLKDDGEGIDAEQIEKTALERSEERKQKAGELQNRINEYNEKYFGEGSALNAAKANDDAARAEYEKAEEARKQAEAEAARKAAEEKNKQNNNNNNSNSGGGNSSGRSSGGGGSGRSGGSSGRSSGGSSSGSENDAPKPKQKIKD